MTKKDYDKAAVVIRTMAVGVPVDWIRPFDPSVDSQSRGKVCEGIALYTAREAFVSLFSNDNPRFDGDRFRKACEVSK